MLIDLDKFFMQTGTSICSCLGGALVVSAFQMPPETLMPYDSFHCLALSWPFVITVNVLIAMSLTAQLYAGPMNAVPGPLFSTYIIGRECGLWERVEPYTIPRRLNKSLCWLRDCLCLFGFGSYMALIACIVLDANASLTKMDFLGLTGGGLLISAAFCSSFLRYRKRRALKQVEMIRGYGHLTPEEREAFIQSILAEVS